MENNLHKKQIELIKFAGKWNLPPNELKQREKFINEAVKYWIDSGFVSKDYFEIRIFKPLFKHLLLKPVSLEMIEDFIFGTVLLAYKQHQKEANEFMLPALKIFSDYHLTNYVRHHRIDKKIGKKDQMIIDGWDIVKTRDAIKDFIEDKPIFAFKQEIDRLKNEFKLHQEKKYKELQNELSGNIIKGFACPHLAPETVEEIFEIMATKDQIRGKQEHFKAIFSQTPQPVKEPVKWLIKHGKTANNTAYHAFLRLMLDCRNKDLTRATLTKANKLFTYNNQPIYPNNKIKYPSSKVKDRWMKSSIAKHFSKISHLIEKQDQK